ncbi:hypothetical protein K432DRAFT_384055 [Lepidopterella palustris CBS 459.81]|uniref:Uncharacterized protein n=1 Tax=Lepidopterella palustris CBS 459.81 TaxID=1314670 RepID=A0A8E2JDA7_9PEZI|nr:hypothetical protein K432DRAFT_384055 [Lepidopterella palustris CBS 459.81]
MLAEQLFEVLMNITTNNSFLAKYQPHQQSNSGKTLPALQPTRHIAFNPRMVSHSMKLAQKHYQPCRLLACR